MRNGLALQMALRANSDIHILNPLEAAPIPSHLVIEVANAKMVQARAASQGLFCPIHWPPSKVVAMNRSWPENVLSVPIDHRYGEEEMLHAAEVLVEVS